jgi:hypothetical protein
MASDRVQKELELAFQPLMRAHTEVRCLRLCSRHWRRTCASSAPCTAIVGGQPHVAGWFSLSCTALYCPVPQMGEPAKYRPSICFDSVNNVLWLKVQKNSGKRSTA